MHLPKAGVAVGVADDEDDDEPNTAAIGDCCSSNSSAAIPICPVPSMVMEEGRRKASTTMK